MFVPFDRLHSTVLTRFKMFKATFNHKLYYLVITERNCHHENKDFFFRHMDSLSR